MTIHRFSYILMFPFLAGIGYVLYNMFYNDFFTYSYMAIPLALAIMAIYLLSPQIDHWWLTKYPVRLDEGLVNILKSKSSFFRSLSGAEDLKYENRMNLFINGKEFIAMGEEKREVPYDITAIVCQAPLEMTFNKEDFMLGDFERIVLYKHPFPSPRFQFLHAMETHVEDGVILLSLEHLQAAINAPDKFYHVGFHAFGEAFFKMNPALPWPDVEKVTWEDLEYISKFAKKDLLKSVGFESLDIMPVCINYYFVFRDRFTERLPNIAKGFDSVFRKNV